MCLIIKIHEFKMPDQTLLKKVTLIPNPSKFHNNKQTNRQGLEHNLFGRGK